MKIIKILFLTITSIITATLSYSAQPFNLAQVNFVQDGQKKEANQKAVDTRLIDAARLGDITTAQQLLNDTSIDINAKDEYYGYTALIWASVNGHKEIVELLLNHDADVNIRDKYSYTAYMWTALENKKILELLKTYEKEYIPYKNKRMEELKKITEDLPNILPSASFPKELVSLVQGYAANDFMTFEQFFKEKEEKLKQSQERNQKENTIIESNSKNTNRCNCIIQ